MKTNVVMHSTALTNGNVNRSLSEGSSVYVRVLKNNGNNSYTVAFGGGKFNIASNLQLEAGTSFFAKIKLEGQKIILQQQNLKIQVQSEKIQKMTARFDEAGKITNPQAISYFERMGLIPDQISYTLYNFMRELGAKYNRQNFIKARAIGTKFKGNEKNAATIAYLMEQKGIPATYDAVEQILDEKGELLSSETEADFDSLSSFDENPFKIFFDNIFNCRNFDTSKVGIVTLFNHLGFNYKDVKIEKNWIKILFDFKYFNDDLKFGTGSFSAMINSLSQMTEKVLLTLNFPKNNFTFLLCFNGSECTSIRFSGSENGMILTEIADILSRKFPGISVEFLQKDELSAFHADEDEILRFNGVI